MSADANHKIRTLWLVGVLHAFTHVYHGALAGLMALSLAGWPCLHAIRKREHLKAPVHPVESTLQ